MNKVTSMASIPCAEQDARDAQAFRRLRESIMRGQALQMGEACLRVQIYGQVPGRAEFEAMVAALPPTREELATAALEQFQAA